MSDYNKLPEEGYRWRQAETPDGVCKILEDLDRIEGEWNSKTTTIDWCTIVLSHTIIAIDFCTVYYYWEWKGQ